MALVYGEVPIHHDVYLHLVKTPGSSYSEVVHRGHSLYTQGAIPDLPQYLGFRSGIGKFMHGTPEGFKADLNNKE